MATIRFREDTWLKVHHHLFGEPGEHFAFLLARWTYSRQEPLLMVREVVLIPDSQVTAHWDGMEINLEGILSAVNAAVKSGDCLIEAHNHGGGTPRFSPTDRNGLDSILRYMHESLPDRPYTATVWGNSVVYGEYFVSDGRSGPIDSITVVNARLSQVVSGKDDHNKIEPVFDRQLPWFTKEGQQQLGRFKIGVVGCGGTGSHVIQNLAYLGGRHFVLVDNKEVDETNMNRLVTATLADIGTPKVILGRRLIKRVTPGASVLALNNCLQSTNALDSLKGMDILFGCVDNDGARLILNELALAYGIPYFDLAVGIEARGGSVREAGGRVAIVLPGGPCLYCMGEIDQEEAAFSLALPSEQIEQLERGYVTGLDIAAPAVVSLNAVISAMAVNEFAVFLTGARPVNIYTEYDLLGIGRGNKSQWVVPTTFRPNSSCVQCTVTWAGDESMINRYVRVSGN